MKTNDAGVAETKYLARAVALSGLDVEDIFLPKRSQILANGLNFAYLEWSRSDGPPIVFLHGGGLTCHTWDVCCLALADQYRCIAPDLRGHGDSDWPVDPDYSVSVHCDDLEAICASLGLERFILVGMSLGGLVAMSLASKHASRLTALVLVDVGPDIRRDGARKIRRFVSSERELPTIEHFVRRSMEFNPRRDEQLLRQSLTYNLKQLPSGSWTWKHDPRAFTLSSSEAGNASRAEQLWETVPSISCPTLVIRGSESPVFLDEDAAKFASALPDGRWRQIPGAGHTVQGDNPKGLVTALRDFFLEVGID